ncbi:unnamed protein product [Clonostachys chloroleuca]|uniref:Uncharacterized protein n=1 Tax=Clonostachys chloroleuca TaxID=1926264 RepID=A0AA35QFR3_9HYPO|nr:unnamed protein product [Clonostachys chloroleuca]
MLLREMSSSLGTHSLVNCPLDLAIFVKNRTIKGCLAAEVLVEENAKVLEIPEYIRQLRV